MAKKKLYLTRERVSITGVAQKAKVYQDKEGHQHILLNDEKDNLHCARELILISTGETLKNLHDEDYYKLTDNKIGLGRVLYHSNDFEVSLLTWDELQEDKDPNEAVAELKKDFNALVREHRKLRACFWWLYKAIRKSDLELESIAHLEVEYKKIAEEIDKDIQSSIF